MDQLTFLLFLKMADEKTQPPFNQKAIVDARWSWPKLLELDADDLEVHYRHTLEALGKADGVIGVIFREAQNKIQDPAKLKRLIVDLIDKEQWSLLDTDLMVYSYKVGPAKPLRPAQMLTLRRESCWRFPLNSNSSEVDFWGIWGWRRPTFSALASTR